jgi:hypothetical protein
MDVEALAQHLEALDADGEQQLVAGLLQQGWEAGCWIRPTPDQLITATQEEAADLLHKLRRRGRYDRPLIEDPFPHGRDCDPIAGTEPAYVVLTQRCDIVGTLKNEPLIELAHATHCTSANRIENAWKNSPREFPVDPRAQATHLVDLRVRYFISKLDLATLTPRQALPRDTPDWQVRLRFGLRIAQRYTRAAIPDRIVDLVVRPLGERIHADADATRLFSEWALFHGGDHDAKPGLLAIYQVPLDPALSDDQHAIREDEIRIAAEDKFQEILETLSGEAQAALDIDDDHRTRVVSERELTVADWRLSWKLDWDHESFTGQPGAALPLR